MYVLCIIGLMAITDKSLRSLFASYHNIIIVRFILPRSATVFSIALLFLFH
jgi:hypothetical protein